MLGSHPELSVGMSCERAIESLGHGAVDCSGCVLRGAHAQQPSACELVRLNSGALLRVEIASSERAADRFYWLGAIAEAVQGEPLPVGLVRAMDLLCWATGASLAALWVRGALRGEPILTALAGPGRQAVASQTQLDAGWGIPGIVLANAQTTTSADIGNDARRARRGLRKLGGYTCVPLGGADGPLACVELAWSSKGLPSPEHSTLLDSVAPILRDRIQRSRVETRDRLIAQMSAARAAGAQDVNSLDGAARAFAEALKNIATARNVHVLLAPSDSGVEPRVISTNEREATSLCPVAGDVLGCGKLHNEGCQSLGRRRRDWPGQCRRLPTVIEAPNCVPLVADGRFLGSVVIDLGATPQPEGIGLASLLDACCEGARQLLPVATPIERQPTEGPRLSIRCFGPLEVSIDGTAVPLEAFSRRKARTLLGLLLLQAGRPVTASSLSEALWPEVSEDVGRNRLHGVVHCLRQVIEPHPESKRWLHVRNDGELYHFNKDAPHTIDLFRFDVLLREAHEHGNANGIQRQEACLAQAVELYGADLFSDEPYLDGFERARIELRRRCLDAHRTLARLRAARGDVDGALQTLRRGLAHDQHDEELQLDRMRLLCQLGRSAEALATYEQYAEQCKTALGVPPSDEMQRLRQTLA